MNSLRFWIHQLRLWILQSQQNEALKDARFHAERLRLSEERHAALMLRETDMRIAWAQYQRTIRGVMR